MQGTAIETMRLSGTRLAGWSDAEIVEGMASACDQLRTYGMSTAVAGLEQVARTEDDLELGALLILNGVLTACPEYYDELSQLSGLPGIA